LDIKRDPPKKTKKYIAWGVGVAAIVAMSGFITTLKPAAPSVERATLWFDTVKRGEMVRAVSAPGTLVPEHVRIIAAMTSGRVEDLPLRPPANVHPNSLLIKLTNTDVLLAKLQAEQALTQALSSQVQLKTSLLQQKLAQEGLVAQTRTQYENARRNLAVFDSLDKKGLAASNELASARDLGSELKKRLEVEQQRYQDMLTSQKEQIALGEQAIAGLRNVVAEQRNRVNSMMVMAGEEGVLQVLPLELGQWVNSGQELARVAQPGKLKALLRVPETQAKDVAVGQNVSIDLHNGGKGVKGQVTRVEPSSQAGTVTVEVRIVEALPDGARAEASVDGVIEIERLKDVMYVSRPAYGQTESTVGMFKVEPGQKEATRVNVQLGAASVQTIVVKGGLAVGDSVIISDMSQWDTATRVRLK